MNKFSPAVIKELKHYVYIYSHPTTGEIFYVGKGMGNRAFAHLDDTKASNKVDKIKAIRQAGLEPKIEILIHGLDDDDTALRVESSIIDLIGVGNLTNIQSGYKSSSFGRMSIDQINSLYDKQKATITEPAILIRINQAFRYTISSSELYDYTRGYWYLKPENAKFAKYALSIYQGVVQEVYEILDWYEAKATFSVRDDDDNIAKHKGDKLDKRYEFIGRLAPADIREKYKYKDVSEYFKHGNANPIMYVNND